MDNPQKPADHSIGFFPNMISMGVFVLIMAGLFIGVTRFYPELALRYYEKFQQDPGPSVDQIAAEIAPFVRGAISGVEAANNASTRQQGPINISALNGYQAGIKTALLASNNWYNIDRQLFRIRGIEYGVQNALQLSTTTSGRATLAYQVQLIQEIQQSLQVNLEELLTENAGSRQEVLENYLAGLKRLAEESAIEVQNMQNTLSEAQTAYSQADQLSQQYSESFVAETESFITENIDANLEQYLDARKAAEEASVQINSTAEILQRLQPLSQRLPQVINAIEANFDALAGGIKITPTPGVNLPVVEDN